MAGWLHLGKGLIAAAFCVIATVPALALSNDEARHLAARTGFGPTAAEIQALTPLTRDQAVDRILAGLRTTPTQAWPGWVYGTNPDPANNAHIGELRQFWYQEMAATPSPLTERLTLFLHNHFTSAWDKSSSIFMARQNALFRMAAGANFATLLHQVARDPAMMLYLNTAQNHVAAPNENFARELMELFTLGAGNYTETDVREAARAFTGWHLDWTTGAVSIVASDHDSGSKTFLGHTGNLGGDDVLDIILQQPAAASFVTAKLWREFVSPTPDPTELQAIAGAFAASGYDMRTMLRALFLTPSFWDPANRGVLVKSPAEFLVGLFKSTGLPSMEAGAASATGGRLGQSLFQPPNVKGWPGYLTWITTQTLTDRSNAVESTVRQWRSEILPSLVAAGATDVPLAASDVGAMTTTLLPLPATYASPAGTPTLSTTLDFLLHDPAFNLK